MSAGFSRVQAVSAGRGIDLRFALENRSDDAWRKQEGFCVGWQLFDPGSAAFLEEGAWDDAGEELPAGETRELEMRIELPEEDGRYHVYVSPRTAEGWHYRQHWPFLLVEAEVASGEARLESAGVTTLGRMRRAQLPGALRRAVTLPMLTAWRNRGLIRSLARRELAARYRGSLGDVVWTVLHPLLLMLTYYFVFGLVLKSRFGNDPSPSGFVLYFLAGMLPWLPFSEAVGRAPSVILEHRNYVKKLMFPVETLPLSQAVAALATEAFALLIFAVLLLATRGGVPVSALWLPVLMVPQFVLTVGVAWLLAALGVYLRDLGQVIGFLLTLVFFLTPICYPEDKLPGAVLPLLSKSPIYVLVRGYRDVLLEGRAPDAWSIAGLWLFACAVAVIGFACFHRLRRSFPDVI